MGCRDANSNPSQLKKSAGGIWPPRDKCGILPRWKVNLSRRTPGRRGLGPPGDPRGMIPGVRRDRIKNWIPTPLLIITPNSRILIYRRGGCRRREEILSRARAPGSSAAPEEIPLSFPKGKYIHPIIFSFSPVRDVIIGIANQILENYNSGNLIWL